MSYSDCSLHLWFNLCLKVICELAKSTTTADCAFPASTENGAVVPHAMNYKAEDTAGPSVDKAANRSSVQPCSEKSYDQDCTECHITRRDPTPSELNMCLHALSYKASALPYKFALRFT